MWYNKRVVREKYTSLLNKLFKSAADVKTEKEAYYDELHNY